eukprot:363474-Chlamydomonas_euryale.AAC.16
MLGKHGTQQEHCNCAVVQTRVMCTYRAWGQHQGTAPAAAAAVVAMAVVTAAAMVATVGATAATVATAVATEATAEATEVTAATVETAAATVVTAAATVVMAVAVMATAAVVTAAKPLGVETDADQVDLERRQATEDLVRTCPNLLLAVQRLPRAVCTAPARR